MVHLTTYIHWDPPSAHPSPPLFSPIAGHLAFWGRSPRRGDGFHTWKNEREFTNKKPRAIKKASCSTISSKKIVCKRFNEDFYSDHFLCCPLIYHGNMTFLWSSNGWPFFVTKLPTKLDPLGRGPCPKLERHVKNVTVWQTPQRLKTRNEYLESANCTILQTVGIFISMPSQFSIDFRVKLQMKFWNVFCGFVRSSSSNSPIST